MRRRRRVHDDLRKASPLEQLTAVSGDPALQHELEHVTGTEYESSSGFRKAWDRFQLFVFSGR